MSYFGYTVNKTSTKAKIYENANKIATILLFAYF